LNYNNSNINRNNNNKNNGFSVRCTQYSLFEPADFAGSLYSKEDLLNDLFFAYYECRKNKRNTINALAFEMEFEKQLIQLSHEIWGNCYKIGRSLCFVVKKPVYREIFAADFRDRVVHHYIIGSVIFRLENYFHPRSFACRYGKGTLYGIKKLQSDMSEALKISSNSWILKLDISGYFMNIDRSILKNKFLQWLEREDDMPSKKILFQLFSQIIDHEPTIQAIRKGNPYDWAKIPKHKSLFGTEKGKGLPIGNLSSQILANFYLTEFDFYVTNDLRINFYGRYVDDFYLIHESKEYLLKCKQKIDSFLENQLGLKLHPQKVYMQPVIRGCAFLGAFVYSSHLLVGKRLKKNLFTFHKNVSSKQLEDSWQSYQGHCKHFQSKSLLQKVKIKINL
jgi:RNA-directed DNA polymerase